MSTFGRIARFLFAFLCVALLALSLARDPSQRDFLAAIKSEAYMLTGSARSLARGGKNTYQVPSPVVVKISPKAGTEVAVRTTRVYFEGVTYRITPAADSAAYHGAVNANRAVIGAYVSATQKQRAAYYRSFIEDPAQKSTIDKLCKALRKIRDDRGLTRDRYAEFLTKYVQCIPYDEDRGSGDALGLGGKGDPRFPIQVLVDGKGDCDEKALLLAALLKHEGYGSALLLFTSEQHMSAGILSQGSGYTASGYEFIETTGPIYISEVPKAFVNGRALASQPQVIPIEGTKSYSTEAVNQVSKIIAARDSALDASAEAKGRAESAGSRGEFSTWKRRYDDCYSAYNYLQVTVTDGKARVSKFKDRKPAYAWIQTHAWWTN